MVAACSQRIVIGGPPRTGKTTASYELAATLGIRPELVRSTSDLYGVLDREDAIAEAASWLDLPGPWLVEGTLAVWALRHWLRSHPGTPCDRFIWYREPLVPLTPAQAAMAKGAETVLSQILSPLLLRGLRPVLRASAGAEVRA